MNKPRYRYNHKKIILAFNAACVQMRITAKELGLLAEAMQSDLDNVPFDYPKCLDRIVDVAMEGVEAKILGFKRIDKLNERIMYLKEVDDCLSLISCNHLSADISHNHPC